MSNDQGEPVEEAGPAMPVEILGFSEVPQAGDIFNVVSEDKLARQLASRRSERKRAEENKLPEPSVLMICLCKIKRARLRSLILLLRRMSKAQWKR